MGAETLSPSRELPAMTHHRPRRALCSFALVVAGLLAQAAIAAEAPPTLSPAATMTQTAKGTFEVQLNNAPAAEGTEAAKIGRMSIRKQLHGDLEGTSLGEMLAVRSSVAGSAGYVAMERVEATLAGRTGSFVLMHLGEMNRGQQRLTVQVIPDSATGELVGLSGTFSIDIKDGKHFYEFRYQLPTH
ncbi:Protein of unknown function [Roseateles sp. YR242]|uniref:DUF3224 domain-containing protein n=1 Tax=Roseateles sp. YR242 TaxID=1855305 RepID=UPI0008C070E0|nr:DUF3224 domain-containing protein [Roseateles sp. YR242]SEK31948.1 Protein of unknown function [Roseateles sp. YR242]